jgi:hypothetical protein
MIGIDRITPRLHLSENICSKPLISQSLKPLSRLHIINLPPFILLDPLLRNPDQRLLHPITYLPAPTHKQFGAFIEQLDDLRSIVVQSILDVLASV